MPCAALSAVANTCRSHLWRFATTHHACQIEDFLERRLQTQVFKLGLAKSVHHARVLIRQRHIRYVVGATVGVWAMPELVVVAFAVAAATYGLY